MNVQNTASGARGRFDDRHLAGTLRRATLIEVADAAGVSRQTVSNVINYPQRVAPLTRERVSREIERLGFKPSLAARALRRRKADALGIQLNSTSQRRLADILDPFLVELAVAAKRHDIHVVTFAADDPDDPTSEYEHLLAMQMVDGFVLTDTRHQDPRPAWLRANGVPFVSFGRIWDDPAFRSWADVDGFAGVASGVRHLAERGYRRIGFLGWPQSSPVGDDRRAGWVSATTDLGRYDADLQTAARDDVHAAVQASIPLLNRLERGDGLICASDSLALGAWMVLRDRGLRPGVDIGLVGFDDTTVAESLGITSLRQPLPDIADTILDLVNKHPSRDTAGVLLQPTVVPRSSSSRTPS